MKTIQSKQFVQFLEEHKYIRHKDPDITLIRANTIDEKIIPIAKSREEWSALDILEHEKLWEDHKLRLVLGCDYELVSDYVLHEFACRCVDKVLGQTDSVTLEVEYKSCLKGIAAKRKWLKGEISEGQLIGVFNYVDSMRYLRHREILKAVGRREAGPIDLGECVVTAHTLDLIAILKNIHYLVTAAAAAATSPYYDEDVIFAADMAAAAEAVRFEFALAQTRANATLPKEEKERMRQSAASFEFSRAKERQVQILIDLLKEVEPNDAK